MSARETVSRNVRQLRQARGWTQAQLAEAIGLGWSEDTTGQAEHGRRAWTADEIAAAAQALGVAPGRLFRSSACEYCYGTPGPMTKCLGCGAEASDAAISVEAPAQPVPVRRRNRLTDKRLRAVAEAYCAADRDGLPPTRTVADRFAVPHSTAAKWVGHARKRGFLGETTGGAEAQR